MSYRIKSLDLLVRDIGPPRLDFTVGQGQSLFPDWMRINVETRLELESTRGGLAWGCSADWPSFGWLDKRPDVPARKKLRQLLHLTLAARETFLAYPTFESPFEAWRRAHDDFLASDLARGAVPLCAQFALALVERAVLDAWCRLERISFHRALLESRLGFDPGTIHPELKGLAYADLLPRSPPQRIHVRHTIGQQDPLTEADTKTGPVPGDGEPYTLDEAVKRQGIRSFKIKICGDPDQDLDRLAKIWDLIHDRSPIVTLDGNEAFGDAEAFAAFVDLLEARQPALFDRIRYIEQPLNRASTNDPDQAPVIRAVGAAKALLIDEADDSLASFREAAAIGYRGVSHKNCKGIFKSLANDAYRRFPPFRDRELFLSAEDLTCMPLVSLHQDFVVAGALGLDHAERNAHHFYAGLAHLTPTERETAAMMYPNLYRRGDDNLFLNIQDGQLDVSDLQSEGLGVATPPDWESMTSLQAWLDAFAADG